MTKKVNMAARHRFWLTFFGFALLPPALIMLGWHFFAQEQITQATRQETMEIRRELRELRRECSDQIFIQKRLNTLYGLMAEEDLTVKLIEQHLAAVKAEGLGFIKFRFFDRRRSMLSIKGDSPKNRVIVQRIFDALTQPEVEGESKLLERYRSFFDGFTGGIPPAEIANDKSTLLRVTIGGQPGFFYWNTFYNSWDNESFCGGVVAYCLLSEIPKNLAFNSLLLARNRQALPGRQYGMVDLEQPSESLIFAAKKKNAIADVADLCREIGEMRRNFITETSYEKKLLVVEHFDSGRLVFCLADPGWQRFKNHDLLIHIGLLVFVVMVGRLAFTGMSGQHAMMKANFERWGLVLAISAPVLSFVLIGFQYTVVSRQVACQDVWANLATHIENVDKNYEVAVDNLAKVYSQLVVHESIKKVAVAKLSALMEDLQAKDALNRLFVVDHNGQILFQWPQSRSAQDFIRKLIPTIGRRIYSLHQPGEQSLHNKVSDMMVESITDSYAEVIGDSRAGLFRNFENLNQINEFWFANRRYYVYSAFIPRAVGEKPNLLVIWHGTESFSERYLLRQVKRNLETPATRQPIRLAVVQRQQLQMPYPREFNKYPFATAMLERVNGAETQQNSIEEKDGESWLVSASPLKRIPGYVLFAMYPLCLIEEHIHILYLKILFAACAGFMIPIIMQKLRK